MKSAEVPGTPAAAAQDAAATETLDTPSSGTHKKVLHHCSLHEFNKSQIYAAAVKSELHVNEV